jgi:hypothetical protein
MGGCIRFFGGSIRSLFMLDGGGGGLSWRSVDIRTRLFDLVHILCATLRLECRLSRSCSCGGENRFRSSVVLPVSCDSGFGWVYFIVRRGTGGVLSGPTFQAWQVLAVVWSRTSLRGS